MLTLLLLSATSAAQPSTDVRRVEVVAGEPWLVGSAPSPTEGPWTGATLDGGLTVWVGPDVAADRELTVGSSWQVGPASCTVDRLSSVTTGYIDADPGEPPSAEPYCGSPTTWAHLRCDQPIDQQFAVPNGTPAVVVATNEGEVDRPEAAALVQAHKSWAPHRQAIESAAAAHPLPDGTAPVSESLRVTRYSAGGEAWLLVDSEIMWGDGSGACGGEGGTSRALTVLTDTRRPKVVSQVWREDSAWVMNLLVVDGAPLLHMALDGSEYLGADTGKLLFPANVCICMC
jgi:hypothetical protein